MCENAFSYTFRPGTFMLGQLPPCHTLSVKELDIWNLAQTAKFLKVVVAFRYTETVIDVDGSGPIPPVAVRCEFFPDGRNITYVDHSQMESTRVRKSFVFVQKL
jgi:hypothetical protein